MDLRGRVRHRRVGVGADRALNALKALDRIRDPRRPFRSSRLYYPFFARRAATDLRDWRCDVVHIVTVSQLAPVIRAASPETRIILHMQDRSLVLRDTDRIERDLRHVDLILGCSDYIADEIRRRFPAHADRCRTLPNGVDVDRFAADSAAPSDGDARLLFVGRLSPEKGVHVLLQAFAAVLERRPSATLTLAGPRAVAPGQFVDPLREDPLLTALAPHFRRPDRYHEWLERLALEHGGGRVRFPGPVPHALLPERYRAADVFVFPSVWHEPFGIPVVEASAAGVPVVATRGGAFPELVEHGRTGLLVERGDAAELAAAILRLLEDDDLRRRLGQAGRDRTAALYSWDRIVDRLLGLYDEVARRPRRPGARQRLVAAGPAGAEPPEAGA